MTDRQVTDWQRSGPEPGKDYEDIWYDTAGGVAKITINRPEKRNAFRPATLFELSHAFNVARDDPSIGVIILTGAGEAAFCSGGDQKVRGDDGYVDSHGVGRLNVLDLQVQIRRTPKPVIAMVAGYAIGGGHVLHVCCDLTIAADNAIFGQTGPKVGSFDAGYGSSLLAATVGLRPESVGRIRMRLNEGLAGLVGEQLRPQVVEDATRHPRFKYFDEAGEDPYHSFLGVPLIDRGLLQGVLVVQTAEARTFGMDWRRSSATRARWSSSSRPLINGLKRWRETCGGAGTRTP